MADLTAVSLFAGVGGIDLALERAGVTVTAAVEINSAARGVIAQRRPGIALFNDVTKVTPDELRAAGFVPERGILAGGFPCQDLSVAGRRKGLGGARSGLFWHIMRLADALQPRWLLLENVPGLLSSNDGRDMGTVTRALGDSGYGFAYRVLDAQFFGVPQRRRRVFFVGHLGDAGRPVQVLLEPEGGGGDPAPGESAGQGAAATAAPGADGPGVISTLEGGGRRGRRVDAESAAGGHLVVQPVTFQKVVRSGERDADGNLPPEVWAHRPVAATLNLGDNTSESRATELVVQAPIAFGHQAGIDHQASEARTPTLQANKSGAAVAERGVVRRLTPRECERLQGFPDDWTAVSNGKRQADSPRYQQMGNAVAVPCVEWIARRIVAVSAA